MVTVREPEQILNKSTPPRTLGHCAYRDHRDASTSGREERRTRRDLGVHACGCHPALHAARSVPHLVAIRADHRSSLLVGGGRLLRGAGLALFVRPIQVLVLTPLLRARPATHTRGGDHRAAVGADRTGQRAAGEPVRGTRPADRGVERVRLRWTPRARHQLCGARTHPVAAARRPRPRAESPPRAAHGGDHDRALAVGTGRAVGPCRVLPRERRDSPPQARSVRSRRR